MRKPKKFNPHPFDYHEELELEIASLSNLGVGIARVQLDARSENKDIMKSEEDKKYLNIISDKASTKNFCISNSKFSAITNINCKVSGYYDAQFRQLPTDIVGLTVTLTNNDF